MERLAAETGGVTYLKNLIWSRTAHGPKAKHNKTPECPMTQEARAVCEACPESKCPPVIDEDEPMLVGDEGGASGAGGAGGAGAEESAGGDGDGAEDEEMAEGEEEEGEEMAGEEAEAMDEEA